MKKNMKKLLTVLVLTVLMGGLFSSAASAKIDPPLPSCYMKQHMLFSIDPPLP